MSRVDLVLDALRLEVTRRGGGRAWLACPYHGSEGSGTFFVRTTGARAGQNHCFSCKRGGGLIDLVMHVRALEREAASAFVATLGKNYAPPKVRARVVERAPLLARARFRLPHGAIFEPLAEWVTPARRYAVERCLLSPEEVERFGIGYAVDGHLGGRIILPWLGPGRVAAGYSARTFIDAEPKYQTPSASDNADRSTMFGEHLWPLSSARDVVAVTEGALNGLAVSRAFDGALPIAALGGSEIDPMQVAKLATFKRVLLLTDPDPAGAKAAAALERFLLRYTETRRVLFPAGEDALDVQRARGIDFLRALIATALST